MNNQAINKTLKKYEAQPKEYSQGFRRLTVLPQRVRKNINLACIMRGENNDNSMREFLEGLTDREFKNWLKLA